MTVKPTMDLSDEAFMHRMCDDLGATFRVEGELMKAAQPDALPPLLPIDGSIHLRVEHLPVDGLASEEFASGRSDAANHFAAYYSIIEKPQPPIPPPSVS